MRRKGQLQQALRTLPSAPAPSATTPSEGLEEEEPLLRSTDCSLMKMGAHSVASCPWRLRLHPSGASSLLRQSREFQGSVHLPSRPRWNQIRSGSGDRRAVLGPQAQGNLRAAIGMGWVSSWGKNRLAVWLAQRPGWLAWMPSLSLTILTQWVPRGHRSVMPSGFFSA